MNRQVEPQQIIEIARQFQQRVARMKEELGRRRIEADAGAGMVRVVVSGLGEVLEVKIDPAIGGPESGDIQMLEDLVRAAVNEALRRARAAAEEEQRKLTGGLPLPVDLTSFGEIS